MVMSFGRMSEPLTKVQKVDSTTTAKSYNFAYKYEDNNHPTAPTQIGHDHYTYDANGNPTLVTNDSTNTTREMYWDEDNRLMVLSDNGKISRYTYNAAGERIMKSYGTMEGVYINGAPQGITFHETDNFTLYPASIISINKNRFTKHYFLGDKRVASRIGTGLFNNVYGRNGSYVTAGQQDYAERMNQIQKQKESYYKQQGIAPGVPTEKGAYGDPENTGVGYNAVLTELGNHDVPQGWVQTPKPNTTPNTNPGPPVSWNDPSTPDDPQTGYGYIPNDTTKEETFFYHSDHLGSTSYITDDRGNITQYDAYLPYGELLVDEHSSSEDLPYKFNGKQFDEETGLYYYGARYMNPVASIWYGVDPLAEKYINIGSYIYCHSSPIILIDPTGEGDYYAKNGSYLGTDKKKDNFIYIQYSSGKTKFEINGKYQNFQKLDVTRNTFLAFASAINNESSGNKQESMALANVVMNFINDGGSKTLKTLDDVVLYRNSFMRGSNQKAVNEFQGLPINSKNRTLAIAAVINALGYNQGLTGFSDYSGGANTWEGKDLMYTNWPNSHRNYIWSSDSKQLLKQYKLLVHGSVNVDGFKYKNTYGENHQIQVNIKATMIAGKTLFTHLYGGRGEKRYEHLNF
ncbi:RHS repeat-associated core domain-containing protein [Prevotella disiens]|nr:RHS repeat-associated core domain-containing protein [Prevotella disiens]